MEAIHNNWRWAFHGLSLIIFDHAGTDVADQPFVPRSRFQTLVGFLLVYKLHGSLAQLACDELVQCRPRPTRSAIQFQRQQRTRAVNGNAPLLRKTYPVLSTGDNVPVGIPQNAQPAAWLRERVADGKSPDASATSSCSPASVLKRMSLSTATRDRKRHKWIISIVSRSRSPALWRGPSARSRWPYLHPRPALPSRNLSIGR